ncbi:MAG: hypothetical protein WC349_01670 [Patescibacteria group bacterium]|jgi:hypothetical protein
MAKNLDGIKKLNPEEIKENRKIVLKYIGEKDPEPIKESNVAAKIPSAFRKVDGIKSRVNNIFNKPAPATEKPVNSKKEVEINLGKIKQEKFKKEELIKKEIVQKAKLEATEKIKIEEAKRWREKLKLEEEAEAGERIIKENQRLGKIKRAEEIKRLRQEIELAKIKAAEKRKINRQKAFKLFKKNFNNKLNEILLVIRRNIGYAVLYLALFLTISYAVFCLLVLRFNLDNNAVRKIDKFLPAPAVVTNQGLINYYDFQEIKNSNYENFNSNDKKVALTKWVIFKQLSKKYDLSFDPSGGNLITAFVADADFNQVGLSRIKKISELLKNTDGIEKLSKYADQYSEVTYYDNESAREKFDKTIFNLNLNQISNIIFGSDGYYILQVIDKSNDRLGIKYIFVGAKTLNQYVDERLAKIKIFILAN